eukprot:TRINITY_DN1006_c0_g1_i2.p1 TRINITY_DN1006_c0_g1~~TRINITY_DN1006_c0_g1_i2.p1  ORF type:complete len:128 (-),score=45.66 TRINITY_DN1006_c0_g1_i2:84-467(-)
MCIRDRYQRRVHGKEEPDEKQSKCPFCKDLVPEATLECPTCQNSIPFCIASGKHMVVDDCGKCPKCNYPALRTYLIRSLEIENVCPMCGEELTGDEIPQLSLEEAVAYLKERKLDFSKKREEEEKTN